MRFPQVRVAIFADSHSTPVNLTNGTNKAVKAFTEGVNCYSIPDFEVFH